MWKAKTKGKLPKISEKNFVLFVFPTLHSDRSAVAVSRQPSYRAHFGGFTEHLRCAL